MFWRLIAAYEIFAALGHVIMLLLKNDAWLDSLTRYQLIPTAALLGVMGAGHLALRLAPRNHDDIVPAWAAAIVTALLVSLPGLHNSYELLCLPLMLSSLYYRRRILLSCTLLSLVLTALLLLLNAISGVPVTGREAAVAFAALLATSLIGGIVTGRGRALFESLKEAHEREQSLLVRNILNGQLSRMDGLTRLLNQRSFQEHADYIVDGVPAGLTFQLALLDIDNFKSINDTYGHRAGDQVLIAMGRAIKSVLCPDDIVFRYGGEEFAVMLQGKTEAEAKADCLAILEAVRSLVIPDMPGRQITTSIGLAAYEPGLSREEWFQRADDRLYAAKREGKDRLEVWTRPN